MIGRLIGKTINKMQIDFISIFPKLIANWFEQGVIAGALKREIIKINFFNPRDFSDDKFGRVDDRPFGGGAGMVLQYQPLIKIFDHINQSNNQKPLHILLSPQGEKFDQNWAKKLAEKSHICLWCGRYEGIDQRFIDNCINLELSVGDFVLSGGEIAASAIADSIFRLIPGVLNDENSAQNDSFQNGLLDYPNYTRPEKIGIMCAPDILLSGNHKKIANWRLKQALGRTFLLRPDLFDNLILNDQHISLLNQFLQENQTITEKNDDQHH